tara:strand:- start:1574 stop:2176 length:603 start_codon:yes stop_codon:yes gene_type:complete
MQADKGAELIIGFDTKIDKDTYKNHLNKNTILEALHHETITTGDTFYIPTGRVHAIGAGVLLAEIQQTSDITYRIYDYDRIDDKTGEKRELHNDLAIDVIDYQVYENYKTEYEVVKNKSNKLVHVPFFKTNIIFLSGALDKDYSSLESFVIYICVEGEFNITFNENVYTLKLGETILLPAVLNCLKLNSVHAKILEVYYY